MIAQLPPISTIDRHRLRDRTPPRPHATTDDEISRHGFTLVELLVVIAIIGILISLLLPAVNAAREAARRSACTNNLVQLIIGIQHYQQAHNVLPPGTIDAQGPIQNVAQGYHVGWIVQILPYIEERAAYKQFDFNKGVYATENQVVTSHTISILICPSDSMGGGPVSNYAGCHHDVEAPIDVDNHGVLFLNSHVRDADIDDGASYTIFIGEKVIEANDLGWASGTRATLRNTGTPINQVLQTSAANQKAPPAIPPGVNPVLYVGGFSSNHHGGANFAFGDGSVRFMSANTSMTVYQLFGNRADGKVIDRP